jgi:AbrB family looped-hinge helix DNA binding protein
MTEVVVTKKGQVTIPVDLRRKFGLGEGSKVKIEEQDGMIMIRKAQVFLIYQEVALEKAMLMN